MLRVDVVSNRHRTALSTGRDPLRRGEGDPSEERDRNMDDLVMWVSLATLCLLAGALLLAVVAAVLLVLVSVAYAGPGERSKAAVTGARELRSPVEALLRGWPRS